MTEAAAPVPEDVVMGEGRTEVLQGEDGVDGGEEKVHKKKKKVGKMDKKLESMMSKWRQKEEEEPGADQSERDKSRYEYILHSPLHVLSGVLLMFITRLLLISFSLISL